MPYEDIVENKKVVGVVTANDPQNIANIPQRTMLLPRVPMMQQMQQTPQMPFPLLFFLFPRIAMLMSMMQGRFDSGQGRLGVQHITQIIRDKEGRISEIMEFVK